MQQGLNIGIGAWIDRQQGQGARPAFPAAAIPFRLSHLGALTTPEDLVRAVELSLLANRLEDGWQQGAGGVPVYLWDRHRDVVSTMETAISTLSQAERTALAAADAVLYGPDGFAISDRYAMYNETRRIHQDLVLAGADPTEVQAAYQSWITLGHKTVVEEALAVKTSLSRGTSRVLAASDVTRINIALESLGGDVPFAPTLFTPLSATSTEFWTEAEVDLQALEDTIPPEVPRDAWARFRGRKTGSVRFRFIDVDLQRGWFSPEIYAADDWRTATAVADGQGGAGSLPAYYARLYLAQVLDVNNDSVQTAPSPVKPHVGVFDPSRLTVPAGFQPIAAPLRPKPVFLAIKPSMAAANFRRGFDNKRSTRGVSVARPSGLAMATAPSKPVIAAQRISRLDLVPHTKFGPLGRMSKIQSLTAITAIDKLSFAQAQLATPTSPAPPAQTPTYLVGFGRANLPACPNPNSAYQWP